MNKKELTGKDLLLTVLYLPTKQGNINEPIVGRTRLTKMFFLFERELQKAFFDFNIENMPEFFAYNYGPFSKDLVDDLLFFITIGYISEEISNKKITENEIDEYTGDITIDYYVPESNEISSSNMPHESIYKLTEKGINYVEKNILSKYTHEQKQLLSTFKAKANELSLDELLNYVYNKYPEMAEKSLVRERYINE
jgi:hypothetical protein